MVAGAARGDATRHLGAVSDGPVPHAATYQSSLTLMQDYVDLMGDNTDEFFAMNIALSNHIGSQLGCG